MSWSLPRLYLSPQRTSRSSELSVRRPDFCTATLRRWCLSMGTALEATHGGRIAAVSRVDVSGDAPDGRDTYSGEAMNLAIGHVTLQVLHHCPAIRHGLQLRGRAQVAKEFAAFLHRTQRQDRPIQGALGQLLLAGGDGSVLFHGMAARTNVLAR